MDSSRRDFVSGVGGTLLAWPLLLAAQTSNRKLIGFLGGRSRSTQAKPDPYYDAFIQGLQGLGYVDGQNITIEWRFADGRFERLPSLAAELVKLKVDVLVTNGTQGALAVQRATRTIPIVFVGVGDPVGIGLVASLAHPGGNVTGATNLAAEVLPKQLELLSQIVPKASRIAVIFNPGNASNLDGLERCQTLARQLDTHVLPVSAYTPDDIERGFSLIAHERAEGLIVLADNLFAIKRFQITRAALKLRLPAIYPFAEDAEAGGLVSYGASNVENYRSGAGYVDKILKGAKPSDLPVEQANRFELVLNNKTAKALAIKFPQSLLQRADRLIE